jgi:hypothetical protein
MSLLGSKCVRCGSRTRAVYQSRPTCEACRQEIELALVAAGEARRLCPADGAVLAKQIAHGVIIDRCPSCRGIWLDAGELERLTGEAVYEAAIAMAGGVVPPA